MWLSPEQVLKADLPEVPKLNVLSAVPIDLSRENIKACFKKHKRTPRLRPQPARDGTFTVVCYGPSLKNTFDGVIRETQLGHTICTVSGAHDFCIENGLIPDYHADLDGRERKAEFVRNAHKDVTYLMASVCHPKTWEYLDGHKVMIWHLGELNENDKIIAAKEPDAVMLRSAQCIGLNALILGHALGFRKFSLYGMDCSYGADGESHSGPHNGDHVENRIEVECDGKRFFTRVEWIQYCRNFTDGLFHLMKGCSFQIHGDGLFQTYARSLRKET